LLLLLIYAFDFHADYAASLPAIFADYATPFQRCLPIFFGFRHFSRHYYATLAAIAAIFADAIAAFRHYTAFIAEHAAAIFISPLLR
jgi:hypothetical protein